MAKNWRLTADGKIFRFGRKRYPNGDFYEGEFLSGVREGKGTFKYGNGNEYVGSFKANKFHGFGVFTWAPFAEGNVVVKNRRYEGHWERGCKSGEGMFVLGTGDKYEGGFKSDMYDGQGKFFKRNGDTMEGCWRRGHLNGQAVIDFANGDRYEGEFFAGRFQGQGRYTYNHGRGWYEGEYNQGKQHGRGTRVYSNSNRYEGSFRFGVPDGEGIMEYANGSQYVGMWRGGHPEGRGVMVYSNGEKYEGDFLQGIYFGRGRYTYADGGFYDGEFIRRKGGYKHGVTFPDPDGKRNGFGVRVWVSGDKYEGDWSNDTMEGKCIIRKASGGKFEGCHRHGKKCGYGVETWGNTLNISYRCPMGHRHEGNGFCRYEGYWTDGYFHGSGTFVCFDGRRYEGQWRRGRRHGVGHHVMIPFHERGDQKRQFLGGFDAMYRMISYRGDWEDGERTGKGTVEFPNGIRVTGQLVNGAFQGKVLWEYPSGGKRWGLYREGHRLGWETEDAS